MRHSAGVAGRSDLVPLRVLVGITEHCEAIASGAGALGEDIRVDAVVASAPRGERARCAGARHHLPVHFLQP